MILAKILPRSHTAQVLPIPISPSIGRWHPRPVCADRHLVQVPPELLATVKLLAFVREETMGNTIGRCIRRALDNIAKDLPSWPIPKQVELLVPEKLRARVTADGRVPSPYIYKDRPDGMKLVSVPLSREERVTARIVAFGQLTSLAKWGAEATEIELRGLSDGRELWKLPQQEQIETLLPNDQAAWENAQKVMVSSGHATRGLARECFEPDADLLSKTG